MMTVAGNGHRVVTAGEVMAAAKACADRWRGDDGITGVYGVPRGGCAPAAAVAALLGVALVDAPSASTLVVDDLVDSGDTLAPYSGRRVDALFRKPHSPDDVAPEAHTFDGWLVFPWEVGETGPEANVARLLQHIGEDPKRDGLLDTPSRVVRAMTEMTAGMRDDPATILATVFDEAHDQLVVLGGIEFSSLCEHHLLPFVGEATVGYVPNGKVVGLSKLARLVECYARRLQVQERMTDQIADAIMDHLAPLGAAVLIRAHHSCMGCRGVRKPSAVMSTTALKGILMHSEAARAEFYAVARSLSIPT